jgi:hypothetical protein
MITIAVKILLGFMVEFSLLKHSLSLCSRHLSPNVIRNAKLNFRKYQRTSLSSTIESGAHYNFIVSTAKFDAPKQLSTLIELLKINGETIMDPNDRVGLNPFLIPISKGKNGTLCYIRWPTQKEDMDLQIVRTNEVGVSLVSLNTDHFCRRIAIELDFKGNTNTTEAIKILNKDTMVYNIGDYLPFLKSGKFPAITENDLRLILDRYLLTKVGPFPDCFERIANNFLEKGNEISALVTCERAVSLFYSWGHPIMFHAKILSKAGRDKEARDSARAAMGLPKWTIASSKEVIIFIIFIVFFFFLRIVVIYFIL